MGTETEGQRRAIISEIRRTYTAIGGNLRRYRRRQSMTKFNPGPLHSRLSRFHHPSATSMHDRRILHESGQVQTRFPNKIRNGWLPALHQSQHNGTDDTRRLYQEIVPSEGAASEQTSSRARYGTDLTVTDGGSQPSRVLIL